MKHSYWLSYRLQVVCVAAAMLFGAEFTCSAQVQNRPPLPNANHQPGAAPDDAWEQQQHKEMQKQANLQRQEEIKKDSEKLLELATELKQAVDKSNENTLSLDVVKKAEQIEKLARAVKDKMKGP